jgi:hypothetical protein
MLQPGVQNFLNTMQLSAPHFAHVIKSGVNMCPEIAKTGIINEYSYEHSERRHTDGNGRLDSNIAHHSLPW